MSPAQLHLDHEHVDAYCRSLPEATAESPFGPGTVVYKVAGKMFALLALDEPSMNLKCEPARALELREHYLGVEPGYHMNKRHWNTVRWDRGDLDGTLLASWISDSYRLVVEGLPAKRRAELGGERGA